MWEACLKSTLQNAALRKEKEVRRVLGNAFRGGGRGTDRGADVNVNEEGECPARIAKHKRQQASWAWAKDVMTFAYEIGAGLALLENLHLHVSNQANIWLFLFPQEFPLPSF